MQTPLYRITLNTGNEFKVIADSINGNEVINALKNMIIEHPDSHYSFAHVDIYGLQYNEHILTVKFGYLSALYQGKSSELSGKRALRAFISDKLKDSDDFARWEFVGA